MSYTETIVVNSKQQGATNLWLGRLSFIAAAAASLLMTAGLIALMHALIYKEYVEPEEASPTKIGNIHLEIEEPQVAKKQRPQKIEDPIPEPAKVLPKIVIDFDPNEISLPVVAGPTKLVKPTVDFTGSGSLVKRVVAPPVYPRRALARGIEGYVDLVFDVTAAGAVKNIRVTAAEPQGVFEKSAMAAINKYKYRPQEIDGQPVATPNVQERIRYKIEK